MNQSISREIEEKVFRYVPVTPMDKRIIENFIQSKIFQAIKEDRKKLIRKVEEIIQKERFSGAPYALNQIISILEEK